jgi:(R,R)-butanediol dehydrogenase/meso-butanediol dehydrogenase/diacetyl reductase
MRAAVFAGTGQPLRIEEVADPTPQPNELVLKVKACGICGSDLHISDMDDPMGGMAPLHHGDIMGHEFAGEVVEIGKDVGGEWKIGDRVSALPYLACGTCEQCRSGQGYRCLNVIYTGLGRLDGGYAEFVRVGAPQTVRLPAGVDFRHGALVEPLAVALHAVERARIGNGDAVLVIGAGPIGLGVALWCRFFGARRVVVSDLKAGRLEKAAAMGATDGIDAAKEDVIGRFKQVAGGRPDIVFDCVGVPGSQQLAINYAPADGHIVVVGLCMHPDTILPVKAMTKELTISYCTMYRRRDFEMTLEMLDMGRIDPMAMVTDVVGFDAFPAAFHGLKKPADQCKVLLEPERAG